MYAEIAAARGMTLVFGNLFGERTMNVRLIVPNCNRNTMPVVAYGPAIARIAGGFTASQATGGWIDDSYKLIVEPVTVFDCDCPADLPFGYFCPGLEFDCADYTKIHCAKCGHRAARFRLLAQRICEELNQSCVYLEVDGKVEYVK
jgi:hypothetical protein